MRLSRAAFERALRRLDGAAARGFVADLLGARGYRTAVDGAVVTAEPGTGPSMRLLVVAGGRSLPSAVRGPPVDAVLVTGGPVAAAVGAVALRTAARRGSRPARLGAGTPYEWFAYAVDAEARAALADRYLEATEPSALARGRAALAAGAAGLVEGSAALVGGLAGSAWPGRLPTPRRRTAVVLVVALLAVAVATAGPPGLLESSAPDASADGAEPTPEAASVPTATERSRSLPAACPPAPVGAHPAALRPSVRRTAVAAGLDGWRLLATQNLTAFQFDPNDQRAGIVPAARHIAVYEAPGGTQFRLRLDRWTTGAGAEAAVARGGPWTLGLAWGPYAVGVEWQADGAEGDASARRLLAAITTPDGVRLGGACVAALAETDAPA